MKNFEELSSMWTAQPQKEQITADTLLKQVKKGTQSLQQKLLVSILMMAATFIFMIVLFLFFLFNSWLTYAGIFITMGTILIYAILMYRDYRLIASHDPTVEVNIYLQKLKEYQKGRNRMNGKMLYVYSVLLSIGLGLFLIEILRSVPLLVEILAYLAFIGWMAFVTFYLRKKIIKTEQEKIGQVISRLERLKLQFKD
ncbi:MAG: hypothetical protein V5804_03660 [Mucilaginibacter sp.]|uniref:hypothetical protein n=1 Tax=Mucilaginibacter sp. TaxID=1882438 RepID=UPI0034E43F29